MVRTLKSIIILLTLIYTTHTSAQIEQDKILHFSAGVSSGLVAGTIAYGLTTDSNKAFYGALITGTTLGLGKELYDLRSGGSGFDVKDLGATIIGTIASAYLTKLITKQHKRYVNKKRINRTN